MRKQADWKSTAFKKKGSLPHVTQYKSPAKGQASWVDTYF